MTDYNSKIKKANELFNRAWELEKQAHKLTNGAVLNEIEVKINNFISNHKFLHDNLKYKIIVDEYNNGVFEILYSVYYYIEDVYKLPQNGWDLGLYIKNSIYNNDSNDRFYELPHINVQEVDTIEKFNSLKNNLILED